MKTLTAAVLSTFAVLGCHTFAAEEAIVYTSPFMTEARVYAGDLNGGFHVLDRATGEKIWSRQFEGPSIFPPTVTDDIIVVPVLSGRMVGLDPETSEEIWSFAVGKVEHDIRDPLVNADGEVVGDGLLFSSEDFNVYMLDIATGEERWRVTLGEETQARDIPVVDGVAYIGAWDGYLYAIDIEKGEIIWRSDTENDHIGEIRFTPEQGNHFVSAKENGETRSKQLPFVSAAPVVMDDRVIFADSAGNLLAVAKETGKQLWWFRPDNVANVRFAGPRYFIAEYKGVAYYSTVEDKRLFGVDAETGKEVWRNAADVTTYGPLQLVDGIGMWVCVPENDWSKAEVRAFDMNTRETLWTVSGVSGLRPHLEGNAAYFSLSDGSMRGYDLRTGKEIWKLSNGPN